MPIVTGQELCRIMRKHRCTIRQLSDRTGITMKRIRQVRESGISSPNVYRDWVEAIRQREFI